MSRMKNMALQLYSLKEETAKDFLGTVSKVGEMGYGAIQFAGFFDTPAKELKKTLDENSLLVAGSHTPYDQLQGDNLKHTIEYNLEIGNNLLILPFLAEEMRKSVSDYQRVAEFLNEAGEKSKPYNVQIGYHNHDFEFYELEKGQRGFELIFDNTNPELVKVELDCYWAQYAGDNPEDLIRKYQDRILSLHIKDIKNQNGEKFSTVIGTGELDIKGLVEVGKQSGVKWFTVEQERFEGDALQEIALNAKNFKEILAAK